MKSPSCSQGKTYFNYCMDGESPEEDKEETDLRVMVIRVANRVVWLLLIGFRGYLRRHVLVGIAL